MTSRCPLCTHLLFTITTIGLMPILLQHGNLHTTMPDSKVSATSKHAKVELFRGRATGRKPTTETKVWQFDTNILAQTNEPNPSKKGVSKLARTGSGSHRIAIDPGKRFVFDKLTNQPRLASLLLTRCALDRTQIVTRPSLWGTNHGISMNFI